MEKEDIAFYSVYDYSWCFFKKDISLIVKQKVQLCNTIY